ncbi:hypothetical protein [Aliikangiella sp. IMCC44632]
MQKELQVKRISTRALLLPSIIGFSALSYPIFLSGALSGNLTRGDLSVEGFDVLWAPLVMSFLLGTFFSVFGCVFLEIGFRIKSLFGPITIKYIEERDKTL